LFSSYRSDFVIDGFSRKRSASFLNGDACRLQSGLYIGSAEQGLQFSVGVRAPWSLVAACYQPVWTSAILRPQDFCLGLLALLALMFWKWPPWLVVFLGAVLGGVLGMY